MLGTLLLVRGKQQKKRKMKMIIGVDRGHGYIDERGSYTYVQGYNFLIV